MWEKRFMVFTEFQQTEKFFPTNFISVILSPNNYVICKIKVIILVKSNTVKDSLEWKNSMNVKFFCCVTFIIYGTSSSASLNATT